MKQAKYVLFDDLVAFMGFIREMLYEYMYKKCIHKCYFFLTSEYWHKLQMCPNKLYDSQIAVFVDRVSPLVLALKKQYAALQLFGLVIRSYAKA